MPLVHKLIAPMADNKHIETATRRFASLTNHLLSSPTTSPHQLIALSNTSSSRNNNDSYQRVHGDVSSHDVVWKVAFDDFGKDFTDIVYEKAVGEGIAKVLSFSFFFHLHFFLLNIEECIFNFVNMC